MARQKDFPLLIHIATLFRMQRRWPLLILSIVLLILLGGVYTSTVNRGAALPDSTDFYKFYLSAQRVNNGQSIYWLVPPRAQDGDPCHPRNTHAHHQQPVMQSLDNLRLGGVDRCLGPNLNTPIFTALILPLTHLSYERAWWTWCATLITGGALGIVLLVRSFTSNALQGVVSSIAGCAALFLYYPTLASISLGQVGTLLLPPMVLAWRALRRHDELTAGMWLGLASGFKPFLLLLLPGLLILRRRRACAAAASVVIAMGMLGWAIFGVDVHRHYLLVIADITWAGTNWNASWAGLMERILSGQPDSALPQGSDAARLWAGGLSLLTAALVYWRLHRLKIGSAEGIDALMAFGLPASLLASPLGWSYYFPVLALPWLLMWRRSAMMQSPRPWRLALFLPLVLSAPTITIQASPRPETPSLWWGIDSIYCYALISLLGLAMALFHAPGKKDNEQGAH